MQWQSQNLTSLGGPQDTRFPRSGSFRPVPTVPFSLNLSLQKRPKSRILAALFEPPEITVKNGVITPKTGGANRPKIDSKTVIAISHDDDAYFSYADRIIKLDDGKLQDIDQPAPRLAHLHSV
jgi:hypothetical protein